MPTPAMPLISTVRDESAPDRASVVRIVASSSARPTKSGGADGVCWIITRSVEAALLPEYLQMYRADPFTWVDAELVGQRGPDPVVRRESLGLPLGRCQGLDQLEMQRLVQLML